MRSTKQTGEAQPARGITSRPVLRWLVLLLLCTVNILLLTASLRVRAQQKPAPGTNKPAQSASVVSSPAPANAPASAPTPPSPAPAMQRFVLPPLAQHNIIVIDPAHGGPENGAQLSDSLSEKDATLALASRLRSVLQSHNFTVVLTRDGDPAAGLTTDQRAEIANHSAAIACIVIHATATGNGVHLFTSSLQPKSKQALLPWATAQAGFVQQSGDLSGQLQTALYRDHLAAAQAQFSISPLDNLACPAVAIELAPLATDGDTKAAGPGDDNYQQRVAESLATALVFWRGHFDPSAGAQ